MPRRIHIDFETRSACDLRTAGAHKYAAHPTTNILCVGVAVDDKGVEVYRPADVPPDLLREIQNNADAVAHNAPFELAIWNTVGIERYGWPMLSPEQIDCTMARAYAMSLPGSLDGASAAVGIEAGKDMAGHRLMMKMSQPRARKKGLCPTCGGAGCNDSGPIGPCGICDGTGDGFTWWEEDEQFARLFAYCGQDVLVERELDKRLKPLTPHEKKVWLVDYEINCRGVHVDVANAERALQLVKLEQERLNTEMRTVTSNFVATYNSHAALRDWLQMVGVETESVDKATVLELFADPALPPVARRALEIRQEAAKSSTAKLKAMINGASYDHRMRGLFQYHAAGTGRWGGRRIQPQNMPRPKIKQSEIDKIFKALGEGVDSARDYFDLFCSVPPLAAISDCLRGFLSARRGHQLVAADWNAIEARVLAWLANEERVIEIFNTHGKIYEVAAGDIFGVPWESIPKDDFRRQVGKTSELALGFQGGVGAFHSMASNLNVRMAPALRMLWDRASEEHRDRAMSRWNQEKSRTTIPKKEWIASELTKLAWRENHPSIVAYWSNVETAAMAAVRNPGTVYTVSGYKVPTVRYRVNGSFLWCELPSKRTLCYPYPKILPVKTPWKTTRETLTYMSEDSMTKKWERQKGYGGLFVENITQATARCLLANALLEAKAEGWPIVLHVHDELVAEVPVNSGRDHHGLVALIKRLPEWAKGLPVDAEGWTAERFRK